MLSLVNLVEFPAWLRITHFVNVFFLVMLIRSGWEIIASHPRFYWNNHCTPGSEWIKFTRDKVPTEEGAFTARDDQRSLSPLISLPGRAKIGIGRGWHGLVTSLWLINGLVYVVLLFGTGQWRRIVPTSWSVFGEAWDSALIYLSLKAPDIAHFNPYDGLQQLMYFTVVFIAAPLMMATGVAMSPAVVGRFTWYAKIFRNRQTARSLHFLLMCFYVMFTLVHVTLIFVVYPKHNITNIIQGHYEPSKFGQSLITLIIILALMVAFWIAQSYWSLADPRRAQVLLYKATEPFRALTVNHFKSQQSKKQLFTEADISPFHWTNTRFPTEAESPEWTALRAEDFASYRLEIGGLVEKPVSLSMDELKELPVQNNITMHTCMQGWTGIAKWTGVRLRDVLALVEPAEGAEYVMIESFGMAQHMHDGRPVEPYYTCLPKSVAMEDETILAWDRNDAPLSDHFGAPLRLRIESYHGYKMVKWVKSIQWIHDYREIQDGQGGTREDSGYQFINARI